MKKNIIRILLAASLAVLMTFLVLVYSTMYKQNHAIPILEYHHITELEDSDDSWTVSMAAFSEQMSYLNQNCRVVPLKELLEEIRQGKSIPRNTVALTFDDGYRSNFLLAFPVLEKYQFPATIFVTGKLIEIGTIGDNYPALQWADMKVMQGSGLIDIESHTYDLHEELPVGENAILTPSVLAFASTAKGVETQTEHDQRIEKDLFKARQMIEDQLGTKSDILSWPFGAYGKNEIAIAKRAGYQYMTAKVAYSYPSTKPEDFARMAVLSTTSMDDFLKLAQPRQVSYFQAMALQVERIKFHVLRIAKKL